MTGGKGKEKMEIMPGGKGPDKQPVSVRDFFVCSSQQRKGGGLPPLIVPERSGAQGAGAQSSVPGSVAVGGAAGARGGVDAHGQGAGPVTVIGDGDEENSGAMDLDEMPFTPKEHTFAFPLAPMMQGITNSDCRCRSLDKQKFAGGLAQCVLQKVCAGDGQ